MVTKMTGTEKTARHDFLTAVRLQYGDRQIDIVSFGGRARGDNRPDSDVHLAIILADGNGFFWQEKTRLIDMSFGAFMDTGRAIQAGPMAKPMWDSPDQPHNPRFVRAARRDAQPAREAA